MSRKDPVGTFKEGPATLSSPPMIGPAMITRISSLVISNGSNVMKGVVGNFSAQDI